MSYRVRVKEQGLPEGRVSIDVASAIINALRVALRAEAATISARKKTRGPLSKLERASVAMSLVAIEAGSGTMVWESETSSLLDVPREAFNGLIAEAKRDSADASANLAMQKALLTLETLFHLDSPVEWLEFSNDQDEKAKVDIFTVDRIKLSLSQQVNHNSPSGSEVTGRLLELDLASRTFRIHGVADTRCVIEYEDLLEPIVREAMKQFVIARVSIDTAGQRYLVSLETLDMIPQSRFDERRSLGQIIVEQRVQPLTDFESLALEDPDPVSEEDFQAFIRSVRRGAGE